MFGRVDTLIQLVLKREVGYPQSRSSRRIHPHHRHGLLHIVRHLYTRPHMRGLLGFLSWCRSGHLRMALDRRTQDSSLLRYNIVERYRCIQRHTLHCSDKGARRPAHSENLREHIDIHYDNLWGSRRSSDKSSDPRRYHTPRQVHTAGTLANHNSHQGKHLKCTQVEQHTSSPNKRHQGSHPLERLHSSARCYRLGPHRSPDRHCRLGYIPALHFALQVHTDTHHDTPKSRCMA